MERRYPLFIFLVALIIRIAFLVTYQNGIALQNQLMASDANIYIGLANNILDGNGYSSDGVNPNAMKVPVYPIFLSIIFFLGGEHYLCVRIIQCILGSFSCLLIFLLGKELFEYKTGMVAAIIAIFYYPFIQMSAYLVTETLTIFLFLVSSWLLMKSIRNHSIGSLVICGVLLGITTLARPAFLGFYPLIPLILILTSQSKKEGLKQGALIIFGIALALSPWITRNYLHFGQFIPLSTRAAYALYQGNNPMAEGNSGGWWPRGKEYIIPEETAQMTELERNAYFEEKALAFIKNNPKKCIYLLFRKMANMWRPYYSGSSRFSQWVMMFSYIPIMILGIWGIFLSYKNWRKSLIFIGLIVYYVLIHAILVGTIRYRWPMMPLFFIFSAFTLNYLKVKSEVTNRFRLNLKTQKGI